MTAVSTPDSLRTQPMSGSISPQAQEGAVMREITASNDYINNLGNKLFYGDDDGFSSYNTNNKYIASGRTNASTINNPDVTQIIDPNSNDVLLLNMKNMENRISLTDSAMRQVQNTMIPNKQADMNLRPALNALKEKGYTAFLQPNLFPKNANDRFMLTFMNPTTGKMEQIDNPEYLQQLLA